MIHALLRFLLISTVLLCPVTHAHTPLVNESEPPPPASVTEKPAWQEMTVSLPAWPRDTDLIALSIDSSSSDARYFIDQRSVSIGADEVVRYTVVITTPSGARNVNYEGLRCTPRGQYKLYAYGLQQEWVPIASAPWQVLDQNTANAYRVALWQLYLCDNHRFVPYSRSEQLHRLRHPAGHNSSGFIGE